MKYTNLVLVCTAALSLAACGGGSSSDSSIIDAPLDNVTPPVVDTGAVDPIGEEELSAATPAANLLTGRFVDSAVIGLPYATETQSGVTGSDGSFDYLPGETVTFSLGGIELPAVAGAAVVTPLDVFATDNIADVRVINLTRLLQTLDVDAQPDNGITISETAIASATGLSANFAAANFDTQVVNLVANAGSSNTSLIDGESALDHFQETLFNEGIEERPTAAPVATTPPAQQPAANTNTSSNSLVGTSAVFSNFSHDIGGTLTIVDDRTLEITNFTYDGGGPSVFFYLGTDGNYSPQTGGVLVGTQLNGRPFNGETITIDLPPNITLDDFNGVSVWCDIFFVNFGDAQF